ncbi:MAG: type VI secretion system transmembrane protein TssO [Flavobacteriales bacterium]|jgi:TolA-binding protein|nr:type VI secretion system transmembrane protein TssO [Flavobacteriales bacterium]
MDIIQSANEKFWKKIKFFLLFVLSVLGIYILLTKFILKIPVSNNTEILKSIEEFEKVRKTQENLMLSVEEMRQKISAFEYDIHQVQTQDELKRGMLNIESVYKENNLNSKYVFAKQGATLLRVFYETRREHSAVLKNKELIESNLKDCQANID